MSPKQLYFTILSFILTIVIIIAGVYFIRQQQDKFHFVNILSSFYNEVGKEMVASAKTIDLEYFGAWLNTDQNSDLLEQINKSQQEFIYCPDANRESFYVAWVKNSAKLKTGSFECFSTMRGKLLITLDCNKSLVCVRSK